MAFAGLWLCAAVWVVLLLAPALSAHRPMILVAAGLMTVPCWSALRALVRRVPRQGRHRRSGRPAGDRRGRRRRLGARRPRTVRSAWRSGAQCCWCSRGICHRVIGAGHWTYVAAAVLLGFGAAAFAARALGVPVTVVAAVTAVVAVFAVSGGAGAYGTAGPVPGALRRRIARRTTRSPRRAAAAEPGTPMPSAEQVWDRVHVGGADPLRPAGRGRNGRADQRHRVDARRYRVGRHSLSPSICAAVPGIAQPPGRDLAGTRRARRAGRDAGAGRLCTSPDRGLAVAACRGCRTGGAGGRRWGRVVAVTAVSCGWP